MSAPAKPGGAVEEHWLRLDLGTLYERVLDDGRQIDLCPMTFGKVRLCIGEAPCSEHGYEDGWCYEDPIGGLEAAESWDGEGDPPVGWHRHLGSGRRRPDGDPEREYVRR